MSIFLDIMKEELDRNLYKQAAFDAELQKFPKGYLSICKIDGKEYLYRKRREGKKVVSEYIGVVGDDACKKAEYDRKQYEMIKESIKGLKEEEKKLRRAIRDYE